MKIRFNAHDTIDTNAVNQVTAGLDDASSSYENDTQLNILKRFVRGFLAALGDQSAGHEISSKLGYTLTKIYEQFNDLVTSTSEYSDWLDLAEQIQYDDKVEEEGEGE